MKRYSFKQNKAAHITAIAAAVLLHLSLFFWLTNSSKPSVSRQSIRVTMVAPSSQMKRSEVKIVKPKQDFIKSRNQENKSSSVKRTEKKEIKNKKKKKEVEETNDRDFETSGQVSETATAKNSARVDPIFNAAYLQNPSPIYPKRAKRAGMQGEVIFEVLVNTLGEATSVKIVRSSGYKILDRAARKSVGNWHFVPAYFGNVAIEASVLVPIEFKLK